MQKTSFLVLCLLLVASVSAAAGVSAPDELDFGPLITEESKSDDLAIQNTGDEDLTGIGFEVDIDSDYTLDFDQEDFDLDQEDSIDVEVTLEVRSDAGTDDDVSVGTVTITSDQGDVGSFEIIASPRSLLRLDRIRVRTPGESQTITRNGEEITDEVFPGDEVVLEIVLENIYEAETGREDDIVDVKATLLIDGIGEDGDEIELESDNIDLAFEGNERRQTIELAFVVPLYAEQDTYVMELDIEGEDEDGSTLSTEWELLLRVERDSHDLIAENFEISPNPVSCGQQVVMDLRIINIGREDEDYVRYTIASPALGIDQQRSRFEILSDPDEEDFRYQESVRAAIPEVDEDEYEVTLTVYRDFDVIEDRVIRLLDVQDCGDVLLQPEEPDEEGPQIQAPDEPQQTTQRPVATAPPVQVGQTPPVLATPVLEQRGSGPVIALILMLVILVGVALIGVLLLSLRRL